VQLLLSSNTLAQQTARQIALQTAQHDNQQQQPLQHTVTSTKLLCCGHSRSSSGI
jgi:hypothetical protein